MNFFFWWGRGEGFLGNEAVKVKESDCEKMVSANLLFFNTIKKSKLAETIFSQRFGKMVHFFTIAQRSTKEIMASCPCEQP